MNRYAYTPGAHAITIAEEILGCEGWEPPKDIIEKLKTVLLPDEYGDVGEIEYLLHKWRLFVALSHSVKISHLLTGENPPSVLSSKGKRDLKRDLEKWYTEKENSGELNPSIKIYVKDWLSQHQPDDPVNLRLESLEKSVGEILERLIDLEKRFYEVEKTLKSWE